MKLLLVSGFCLLLCMKTTGSFAQTATDTSLQRISFQEFIQHLEEDYAVRFYYDPAWIDSLDFKAFRDGQNIEQVLDSHFQGTDIHYLIRDKGRIILSKSFPLHSDFPANFWKSEAPVPEIAAQQALFDLDASGGEDFSILNIENKLIEFGTKGNQSGKKQLSIAGYVRDAKTGEPLVGAAVFEKETKVGIITDAFGYYVLKLPSGDHTLNISYVGKKDTRRQLRLHRDGQLDIEMEEEILAIDEVVISGEKSQVESVQTGAVKLNLAEIKTIPTLFGEADVMKISLNLPGVQSVGEGTAGFYVRGGSADQNLILLNGAPVYNPNHLFGFFSAFNSSVIKYAELYKSGIQAHYGGRISSVLDVAIRDGNKKRFILTAGVSPLTSKVGIEGPLSGGKGSYILGIRSTYANWLLKALENPALNNSRGFFADGIGKINYQLNDNNNLSISAYHSEDSFRLNADSLYHYSNSNAALRWRHAFSNEFSSLVSAGFTRYAYQLQSTSNPVNAFRLEYALQQSFAHLDFDWFPAPAHQVKFGLHTDLYSLDPGQFTPFDNASRITPRRLNRERGLEYAIFAGDEWTLTPRLSVYGGIRFSWFNVMGPGEVFVYPANLPKEKDFITDTLQYEAGKVIQSYGGPDIRFSVRYKLAENLSVKASYDKIRQYIHMLTNTIAVSPTDTWRLSNAHLKPQIGTQWALGLYKEFPENGLEISLEGYYKQVENMLEYKDGANLLVNEVLETDIIPAFGKNYGLEFLFKKKTGKLNGWISYTWSRAWVQANGNFKEERINEGEFYPANFDKPHNLSVITNYKFSRRYNISLNMSYSSGRPVTLPITQYQLGGNVLAFFSGRNQFRIPAYFRLDFSLNIEGNHKIRKFGHSSWSFSVYNLTGRKNAYSVFSRVNDGNIQTYQLAIFGRPIPTLVYNFELR